VTKESKFLTRAKETYKFHRSKLLVNDKWTITDTSKSLRRSLGGICEDLLIAKWYKTHPEQLDKFDYTYEALDWIRKQKKENDVSELD